MSCTYEGTCTYIHSEVYQPGLQELSPRATVVKKKRGAFVELDSETRAFFIVRSCRSRMKHVGEWYLYEFFSRLLIGLFMGSDLGSLTVGSLFFPLAHSFSQSPSQVVCLPTGFGPNTLCVSAGSSG